MPAPQVTQFPGQRQYLGGGNFAADPSSVVGNAAYWSNRPPPTNIQGQPFQGWESSPLQTPQGAFGRSLARGNVPGASFLMDQPQNPQGGPWWMKLLSGMPFLGSLFSAGNAAMGQQNLLNSARGMGMNTESGTPFMGQPEGFGSRAWSTLGAGLKWAPGGPIVDPLRMGYNVIQGVRGASDFASRTFPDWGAAAGGQAIGAMLPSSWQTPGYSGERGGDSYAPEMGYTPSRGNFASSMIPSSFYQDERGGS